MVMANDEGENEPNQMDTEEAEGGQISSDPKDYPPIIVPPPPVRLSAEQFGKDHPRLIITQIVTENFKSYAGRTVIGPFKPNFNAVVGANGSGKSNVIDAILFVFGYRSTKIRSKKLNVLIHNSDEHPNCNSCSVHVHFAEIFDEVPHGRSTQTQTQSQSQNVEATGGNHDENRAPIGGAYRVVPNSEFVVSRTARSDNSSDYYVDGRRTAFRDIQTLLRRHGIDIDHNRFLILQGEVESIALMKPKAKEADGEDGLLEFLEDILGTNRYKGPLSTLQGRIEKLSELRKYTLGRVKFAEKERKALETANLEAMRFIRKQNRIVHLKNKYLQKLLLTHERDAARAREKCDELVSKLAELAATVERNEAEKQSILDTNRDAFAEHDTLSARQSELKAQIGAYEKEDVTVRHEFGRTKEELTRCAKQLEDERAKAEKLAKEEQDLKDRLELLRAQLESLEQDNERAEQQLAAAQNEVQQAIRPKRAEMDRHESELKKIAASLEERRAKLRLAEQELSLFVAAFEQLDTDLKTAKERLVSSVDETKLNTHKVSEAKKRIETLEKERTTLVSDRERTDAELKVLEPSVRTLRMKLEDARASQAQATSRSAVVRFLFEAQSRGEFDDLPGRPRFHGRLGDLGRVDPQYDIAVSTSCGSLQMLVVDTPEMGQRCMQLLRAHNVGSARLIALDQVTRQLGSAMQRRVTTPENVPRVFDLIEPNDARFLPAFYHGLRDTLLANDLDQARRLAFSQRSGERHRVVTLRGELFEPSGTITGGGHQPIKGLILTQAQRTSSSFSAGRASFGAEKTLTADELARLTDQLENDSRRLDENRQRKFKLESDSNECEREVAKVRQALESAEKELVAKQQLAQNIERELIPELEKKLKQAAPDLKRRKELENAVEKRRAEFDEVNSVAEKIQREKDRLEGEIHELTETKLKRIREELERVRRDSAEKRQEDAKTSVALRNVTRNQTRCTTQLETLAKSQQELEEKKRLLKDRVQKMNEEAAAIVSELKTCSAKLEVGREHIATHRAAIEKLEADNVRHERARIELNEARQTAESRVREKQKQAAACQKRLDELELMPLESDAKDDKSESDGDSDDSDDDNAPEKRGEGEAAGEGEEEAAVPAIPKLKKYAADRLERVDAEKVALKVQQLEEALERAEVNLEAIAAFRAATLEYVARVDELECVTQLRDAQSAALATMGASRLAEFREGFIAIGEALKQIYRTLTIGGDAELELVDSLDPFREGVRFSVRPPNKAWRPVANLSGGEKTLSSLALIFALHRHRASPFYVMDEIDAALDFRNVSIAANYVKQQTANAQFIIISLRSWMYELADRTFGIFKTHQCTKILPIDLGRVPFIPPSSTHTAGQHSQPCALDDRRAVLDALSRAAATASQQPTNRSETAAAAASDVADHEEVAKS